MQKTANLTNSRMVGRSKLARLELIVQLLDYKLITKQEANKLLDLSIEEIQQYLRLKDFSLGRELL